MPRSACWAWLESLLAIVVAGLLTVQSDWFKNKVREKIVAVSQNASGGRVEIGKFNYDWHSLTAEVGPFIIHGREPASAPPFFRADKIRIGLKIISALKKQVDIASLDVEKPQIYVTVAPDGSTNVPTPKIPRSKQNFAEQLLDLKVRHFALRNGFAEYNSQRVPLDVQGNALQATLGYDPPGPAIPALSLRTNCNCPRRKSNILSPSTSIPSSRWNGTPSRCSKPACRRRRQYRIEGRGKRFVRAARPRSKSPRRCRSRI